MERSGFHPELADTTWKFCGVALFQVGLLAGLSLVDESPDAQFDTLFLTSLVLPVLGAILAGRTRSRPAAMATLAFLLARFVWQAADFDDDPVFYLQEVSDLLLVMLAFKTARLCWIIARRHEIRYGRIVTRMLGRLA